jgi:hypothetical protein
LRPQEKLVYWDNSMKNGDGFQSNTSVNCNKETPIKQCTFAILAHGKLLIIGFKDKKWFKFWTKIQNCILE